MNHEDRQKLREAARQALTSSLTSYRYPSKGWELQTSNSWRRIGLHGDGDVLCPTKHQHDGHPDLSAPPGVLDYIVAAQPSVVLDLLDQLDVAEKALDAASQYVAETTEKLAIFEAKLEKIAREQEKAQVLVDEIRKQVLE